MVPRMDATGGRAAMVDRNGTQLKLAGADWLKIIGFLIVQVGGLLGYAETRISGIEQRLAVIETRRDADQASDIKTLQVLDRIESKVSTIVDQFHQVDKRLTVIESRRLGPQGGDSQR